MSDLLKRLENQSIGVNLTLTESRANGRDAKTLIEQLQADVQYQKNLVADLAEQRDQLEGENTRLCYLIKMLYQATSPPKEETNES